MKQHDIAQLLYSTHIEFREILAQLEEVDEMIKQVNPKDTASEMIGSWQASLEAMQNDIRTLSDRFYDDWLNT